MNAAARSIAPAVTASAAEVAGKAKPVAATKRRRKPWKPSGFDELVFRWIKFEGMTQQWVAEQMRIHQSTVSRVVQRYERWQAHAQERERGELNHAERLRVQFWMTYERNEQILASSLRIAGEMERFAEVTKSTTRRPQHEPANQKEISTQTAMVDRSGVAARFLRLAFRVNMEQLKLAEREPLPPLPPLAADEHEELECDAEWQAHEGREEEEKSGRAGEEAAEERCRERPPWRSEDGEGTHEPATVTEASTWKGSGVDAGPSPSNMASRTPPTTPDPVAAPDPVASPAADLNPEPQTPNPAAEPLKLHNLHNDGAAESTVSADEACLCAEIPVRRKKRRAGRIGPPPLVDGDDSAAPKPARKRRREAAFEPGLAAASS